MPIYDVKCKQCQQLFNFLVPISMYDKVNEAAEEAANGGEVTELSKNYECPHCGELNTKRNREIDTNIQKTVIGVSKGNYNSQMF